MKFVKHAGRYVVFKLDDMTPEMRIALDPIREKHNEIRKARGKAPLECLVIESDWPEYEQKWDAIKNRVCFDGLTRQREELHNELVTILQLVNSPERWNEERPESEPYVVSRVRDILWLLQQEKKDREAAEHRLENSERPMLTAS